MQADIFIVLFLWCCGFYKACTEAEVTTPWGWVGWGGVGYWRGTRGIGRKNFRPRCVAWHRCFLQGDLLLRQGLIQTAHIKVTCAHKARSPAPTPSSPLHLIIPSSLSSFLFVTRQAQSVHQT